MEVILQENVPSLGFVGDVVRVKPGFARNFLFPKKLALPATRQYVNLFEHKKKQLEVKKAVKKSEAEEFKKRLEAVRVTLEHLATESGKLFGAVSVSEILDQLASQGFQIDRRLLQIPTPIRTAGEHKVEVKLYRDISAFVTVEVKANVQEVSAEEKAAKKEKRPRKKKTEEATPEAGAATAEAGEVTEAKPAASGKQS